MTASTLNSKSLGNVQIISMIKNSNIETVPFPKKNSADSKLFDFNGATKTITVNGNFTGATTAAVKTLIDAIEAELDGNQTSVIAFSSDMTGSINVMVISFEWSWDCNIAEACATYVLTLAQGTRGGT